MTFVLNTVQYMIEYVSSIIFLLDMISSKINVVNKFGFNAWHMISIVGIILSVVTETI